MVAFFDNEKLIKAWNEHQRLNAEERSPKLFMNEYMQEWKPAPPPKHLCHEPITASTIVSGFEMMTGSGALLEGRRTSQKKLFDAIVEKGCNSCVDCPNLQINESQHHFAAADQLSLNISARCKFKVCVVGLSAASIQGDAVFPRQKKADPDVPLNYDGSW
ncbi:hypothetical protein [Herbaspirillum huttiense]|uniref:Uncharacterized protein n=1 Tax=Herbaspirillum huttiense subsp. lycopersici TaxID=3074428 RepID=A0ABU2EG40_9BURK|nr:hypothetical protein [Herbaspirillum huttiense]MDR9847108.1 hypothetical protein [Herbaspirillum huttiense SE1]